MANRKVTININTTANTTGAQQAAQAMDNLAASSQKAAVNTTAAGKAAGTGARMFGQAGLQIQDAAVQIGAGTSKLTILSQQLPQLLGAFGPAGAIAGAVVAVGAVATQIFMKMSDDTMSAEEKAKKLAETLEKIADAAKKAVKDDIDFGKQKIEDATTAAQQMADELNNVAENQLKLNQTILNSLTEINEIENELKESRDESVDKFKQLEKEAEQAAAARQKQKDIDLANEQLKVTAAEESLTIAKEDLAERQKQKVAAEADLSTQYEALKVARERLQTAKELVQNRPSAQDIGFSQGDPGVAAKAAAAAEAKKGLDNNSLAGEVERLRNKVLDMQESVNKTGELSKEVAEAERKVIAVGGELRQAVEDLSTATNQIDIESMTAEAKASNEKRKEEEKLLGDVVKEMTEGVTASTEGQRKALAVINKNLNDGEIDLKEINSTSAALATLGPLISNAIGGNTQKVSQLITIMNTMQAQSNQLQSQINNLKKLQLTPPPSR
jgi:hypothetical protein